VDTLVVRPYGRPIGIGSEFINAEGEGCVAGFRHLFRDTAKTCFHTCCQPHLHLCAHMGLFTPDFYPLKYVGCLRLEGTNAGCGWQGLGPYKEGNRHK